MLRSLARMNLVSTQHALLPCLAPDHSGLEANVLRFDNPLQAARRCSISLLCAACGVRKQQRLCEFQLPHRIPSRVGKAMPRSASVVSHSRVIAAAAATALLCLAVPA